MPKKLNSSKRAAFARPEELFKLANDYWEKGDLRTAFRIFLKAAKAGNAGSQLNVGHFYDEGLGVRASRPAALYWFKRLYRRRKDAAAATNIGTIWRDEGSSKRALRWFEKAIELGDEDARLDIAKLYIRQQNTGKAIPYLEKVLKSENVTEASAEEAKFLLNTIAGKGNQVQSRPSARSRAL
jgi:TPR repeat protein